MSESTQKNYLLSNVAIDSLKQLSARLSAEARVKISMTKALELAIFYASDRSLNELIEVKK